MLNRYAEAKALDLVDVGHILEKRRHHQISAAVGNGTAEGVEIGKLLFVVTTGVPFQGVQIHRIGDAKILKGAQQFAVDGLRQTDFCGNAIVEIGQHAFAVHTLRRGSQS